jgi:hypothetical protein
MALIADLLAMINHMLLVRCDLLSAFVSLQDMICSALALVKSVDPARSFVAEFLEYFIIASDQQISRDHCDVLSDAIRALEGDSPSDVTTTHLLRCIGVVSVSSVPSQFPIVHPNLLPLFIKNCVDSPKLLDIILFLEKFRFYSRDNILMCHAGTSAIDRQSQDASE